MLQPYANIKTVTLNRSFLNNDLKISDQLYVVLRSRSFQSYHESFPPQISSTFHFIARFSVTAWRKG